MAEYLTQDVDPRLAQSVVDSTTGADGVTTLSNAHGVDVATVVSGEEANSKFNPSNSNGFVDGISISDASRTDKRDDSPTGASGTESTKSTDKPAAQKVAASKKAPVVKSVSLNKAFLSGNSSAPAQPGVGKLTLSLDKGSKGASSGTAASTALAAKPRLVSKMGPSGSRMVGLGQLGGKGGNIPSVWNRNLPPAPVPAKEYTDEELSKHGIHMAERIQTEDPKEAKWADIDDDDDGWVPPDTIEWNDGTKVTLDAVDTPKPTVSAFEKQIGTAALKEQRGSITSQTGVPPPPVLPTAQLKPMESQQARKSEYIPSAPPPKTPWAAVPTGSFPTPRPMPPSLQQYPGRPMPPGRPMFVNTQQHQHQPPPKEVATDDFSRQSWRERQSSQSPSALFNSETGNFDPVGDANRNRDQVRRNSRAEAPGVRPTSLLQRPAGSEHDPQFQQNRFQGRPEHEHHPGMGPVGPMDMGRRRSASIRSAAFSDTSSSAWDNRQQPSNVITEASGVGPGISTGSVDSHHQRTSQGLLYISPTVAGGDQRFGRAGPQSVQPILPPNGVDVPQDPGENPLEAQQRVMKDAREQARARRLAEEAAQEEEKRKRIQKKLAELDEKMKAEAASKAEENPEKEEVNSQSNDNEGNGAASVDDQQASMANQAKTSPATATKSDEISLSSGGTRGTGQEGYPKEDSLRRVDNNIPNGSHHHVGGMNGRSSTYQQSHQQSHQPQSQPQPQAPSQQPSSPTVTTTTTTTPATTHSQLPIHQHQHHQHQQHPLPPPSFSSHNPPTSSSSSSSSFHQPRQSPNTRFAHPSYSYHHNPSNPHHPHPPSNSSSYNPQRFEHGNFRNNIPSMTSPSDKIPASANGHQSAELPKTMTTPTVFPSTRVGDHITLKNIPLAPGKEPYFPVELPQDWKRNGIVKASPWTPTAQETHVKKFAMFLPTTDKEKQIQGSTGKRIWPNGQAHVNENVNKNGNEEAVDLDILLTRYTPQEIVRLGTNSQTMEQIIPGTFSVTFKYLNYYYRSCLQPHHHECDRVVESYTEKVIQEKYNKTLKQENVKDPIEATAATKEEKPKPTKPATQVSEPAKFDEITTRILNLAGHSSFAQKMAADFPKPVWEEPVVRASDMQNWAQGGQQKHAMYVQREKKRFENELEEWERLQAWHRDRNANDKPGKIGGVRYRPQLSSLPDDKSSRSRNQASSQSRNQASSQVDSNLQVISKPAFQGVASEGKPRVLLPKAVNVVVAAPPPKPEPPHTLPPEEEFNDIAFQQEFGSTPTVCLPTVTPQPKPQEDTNAQGLGKKGKDKKRPQFRDYDMISKPVFPIDMTEGPFIAPQIVVKLPGMIIAKSFQSSSTYEGIWKAQQMMSRNQRGHHNDHKSGQHSQSGRSDSSQPRSRNSRGRGQYNSPRNH
ncbi:hypothetical protein AA313_de0209010 [Arthrobotrys entomopaga]|nr:hypothetical protein AA313_de0209010 [Arthrobotrys entomopaga]